MKPILYVLCSSLLAFAVSVHAQQDYPSKPIRLVVPYVVGGAADITPTFSFNTPSFQCCTIHH